MFGSLVGNVRFRKVINFRVLTVIVFYWNGVFSSRKKIDVPTAVWAVFLEPGQRSKTRTIIISSIFDVNVSHFGEFLHNEM